MKRPLDGRNSSPTPIVAPAHACPLPSGGPVCIEDAIRKSSAGVYLRSIHRLRRSGRQSAEPAEAGRGPVISRWALDRGRPRAYNRRGGPRDPGSVAESSGRHRLARLRLGRRPPPESHAHPSHHADRPTGHDLGGDLRRPRAVVLGVHPLRVPSALRGEPPLVRQDQTVWILSVWPALSHADTAVCPAVDARRISGLQRRGDLGIRLSAGGARVRGTPAISALVRGGTARSWRSPRSSNSLRRTKPGSPREFRWHSSS